MFSHQERTKVISTKRKPVKVHLLSRVYLLVWRVMGRRVLQVGWMNWSEKMKEWNERGERMKRERGEEEGRRKMCFASFNFLLRKVHSENILWKQLMIPKPAFSFCSKPLSFLHYLKLSSLAFHLFSLSLIIVSLC